MYDSCIPQMYDSCLTSSRNEESFRRSWLISEGQWNLVPTTLDVPYWLTERDFLRVTPFFRSFHTILLHARAHKGLNVFPRFICPVLWIPNVSYTLPSFKSCDVSLAVCPTPSHSLDVIVELCLPSEYSLVTVHYLRNPRGSLAFASVLSTSIYFLGLSVCVTYSLWINWKSLSHSYRTEAQQHWCEGIKRIQECIPTPVSWFSGENRGECKSVRAWMRASMVHPPGGKRKGKGNKWEREILIGAHRLHQRLWNVPLLVYSTHLVSTFWTRENGSRSQKIRKCGWKPQSLCGTSAHRLRLEDYRRSSVGSFGFCAESQVIIQPLAFHNPHPSSSNLTKAGCWDQQFLGYLYLFQRLGRSRLRCV